jgi:accessory gene regulator B
MTQHWAEKLADSLLFNGFIKECDKEIYSYHIQILLEKIIGFSVIFLISFWIKKVGQTILFVFESVQEVFTRIALSDVL